MRPALPTVLALSLFLALPAHADEDAPAEKPASESTAAQALPRVPLEERSQDNAQGLERQLPGNEQQMLQAGDEPFLALWKPANAPKAKGLVILLPGADESADWPRAIQPLRLKLPDAGWSTLSLSLPDPASAPLPPAILPRPPEAASPAADKPAATDTADTDAGTANPDEKPAPETATAEPVDPSLRVFAHIQAGIEFAEQQDAGNIVLLGHGTGAYWAALYLKERKPEPIRRLVTVAAQLPAGQTPALDELIPGLKLATGDFFYKDLPVERATALRRKQASKRLGHDSYTQIALETLPGNQPDEQEQLYRRVRGWLDKQ